VRRWSTPVLPLTRPSNVVPDKLDDNQNSEASEQDADQRYEQIDMLHIHRGFPYRAPSPIEGLAVAMNSKVAGLSRPGNIVVTILV
jgi:hypothetical protein